MAHNPKDLRRRSTISLTGGKQIMFFDYATTHTLAEVTTVGFMNTSKDQLSVGSIIDAVVDVNATPNYVTLKCTAVTAGAVAVALETPVS